MTRRVGALVVALAVSVGACTFETGAEESAPTTRAGETSDGVPTAEPRGEVRPDAPTTTASTVPDPGVNGGSCGWVTYTPPTATEPFGGELCRPASPQARDVGIVLVHGGGGIAGDHAAVAAWSEGYVAAGYTTLAIDYLLFDPGGESPVFPGPEQDVKAAVQYLRGAAPALGLDPDRIVLQGMSAGARLGAIAYTTAGDPAFAGPALWAGISDTVDAFVGFYSPYDGTTQYDAQYYGGERNDPDPAVRRRWAVADALVTAARPGAVTGPAALFTGALDWSELAVQQEQLAELVRAAGEDAVTTVYPGGEHGYDAGPGGLSVGGEAALATLVTWLDAQFPPG